MPRGLPDLTLPGSPILQSSLHTTHDTPHSKNKRQQGARRLIEPLQRPLLSLRGKPGLVFSFATGSPHSVGQSDLCLAYSPASSPRPSPPSAALSIVCTFSVHTIALLTWEPLADWKALLQPSLAAPKLHAHSVDARGQALDSLPARRPEDCDPVRRWALL